MTFRKGNPLIEQGLRAHSKANLARAFAVWFVACVSVCGCGATTVKSGQPEKPVSAPSSVVFIGDSISAIWGSGHEGAQFAEHPSWIDKGVGGQNSSQVLARFQTDVIDLHPEIVHILVGTNDVYPGWTLGPSGANVQAMVQMALANGIHVILATIPPWGCDASNCTLAESADPTSSRYDRINTWNAWLEEYALSQGIPVVDYHSALLASDSQHYMPNLTLDGVHPSAAGYLVMTPMVENVINAMSSLYANK